jgi:hypothetical protein
MDAEALRAALVGDSDTGSGDDEDDPITVAGRKLATKLKLDDEGMDALTELISAVVAEGR